MSLELTAVDVPARTRTVAPSEPTIFESEVVPFLLANPGKAVQLSLPGTALSASRRQFRAAAVKVGKTGRTDLPTKLDETSDDVVVKFWLVDKIVRAKTEEAPKPRARTKR